MAVLSVPELEFHEPIARLDEPWTCLALALNKDHLVVRCTPLFRSPVAEVRREAEGLKLRFTHIDGRDEHRVLPVPQSRLLELPSPTPVSARDVPGAGCAAAPEAKRKTSAVTIESVHDIGRRNDLLYLGYGVSKTLLIAEHWAYKGCLPSDDGDGVSVSCPPGPKQTSGRFWIEDQHPVGPMVRFRWTDRQDYEGAVLLPCRSRPVLRKPDGFQGGITNYW
jgi:hypothetical protein